MKTTKTISALHEEHKIWLNKLAFYSDEIRIMTKRLQEIAAKNTSDAVLSQVDHFSNQLLIQEEQISQLTRQIEKHEFVLDETADFDPAAMDQELSKDHTIQRENMDTFEKIFNEMRKEFIGFISRWM